MQSAATARARRSDAASSIGGGLRKPAKPIAAAGPRDKNSSPRPDHAIAFWAPLQTAKAGWRANASKS
jgi:hypothetical protein